MGVRGVSLAGVLVALTLLCLSPAAGFAASAEEGVQVDPGSPAAQEYALALTQARRTGSGSAGSGSSSHSATRGERSETPFGDGIKPPASGGSSKSGAGSKAVGRGGHGTPSPGAPTTRSGVEAAVPAVVLRAERSHSSGGDGSTLALIGGGIAILVLGGFGGTVLRHNRRPTPQA
jgi:hypothetical protein